VAAGEATVPIILNSQAQAVLLVGLHQAGAERLTQRAGLRADRELEVGGRADLGHFEKQEAEPAEHRRGLASDRDALQADFGHFFLVLDREHGQPDGAQ